MQSGSNYERDGYIFPLTAMSEKAARAIRERVENFEMSNPTGRPFKDVVKSKSHLLCMAVLDLVRHEKILDAVESVLGSDILCWSAGLFIKEAGNPAYVSWHQDVSYWGLEPHDVVAAWVALSPATIESGAMRFLPGSHIGPLLEHIDTRDTNNLLARGQAICGPVDEGAAIDVVLRPGQFSLHHARLAHSSPPNKSNDRRIGITIRYLAPHVRQVLRPHDSAMLVRGKDAFGHFAEDPVPNKDYEPWAIDLSRELSKFTSGEPG